MNFWNFKAFVYQKARRLPGFHQILQAEIGRIKALAEQLPTPAMVLDIGVGTGATQVFDLKTVSITGIDLSYNMLQQSARLHPELTLVQANATQLPIQTGCIERIHCIGLTEYLADPVPLLDEMNRVLKQGGYCIITLAPKSFLNRLRLVWGSRLYLRSRADWERQTLKLNWNLIREYRTLLQIQLLYQKK